MVAETNASNQKALEHRLEDAKIKKDCENEIELAMMELEKSNTDRQMLQYEALKLAQRSYNGKYITSTNITTMPEDDPSSAVLAGLLNKFEVTKKAIGQ